VGKIGGEWIVLAEQIEHGNEAIVQATKK